MFIAALALSVAVSTAPTQSAYTGTEPIRVASCSLAPAAPDLSLPWGASALADSASTAISFVNEAPATVASVTFAVSDGRTTREIVDKGIFSSGVAIDHSFATPEFQSDLRDVSCSVKSVAFTDGSVWQAQ